MNKIRLGACLVVPILLVACQNTGSAEGGTSTGGGETHTEQYTVKESARDSSVQGRDADNNGIRDDVDALLIANYSNVNQLKAAKMTASILQGILLSPPADSQQAYALSERYIHSAYCMQIAGIDQPFTVGRLLETYTVNSELRVTAYEKYMRLLSGSTLSVGTPSCPEISG